MFGRFKPGGEERCVVDWYDMHHGTNRATDLIEALKKVVYHLLKNLLRKIDKMETMKAIMESHVKTGRKESSHRDLSKYALKGLVYQLFKTLLRKISTMANDVRNVIKYLNRCFLTDIPEVKYIRRYPPPQNLTQPTAWRSIKAEAIYFIRCNSLTEDTTAAEQKNMKNGKRCGECCVSYFSKTDGHVSTLIGFLLTEGREVK
ncbi:unnamed protein product, partial [Mesorhabditis spiculigera]